MLLNDCEKNTIFVSELLLSGHLFLFNELKRKLKETNVLLRTLSSTNDIWLADFMPLQRTDSKFTFYNYDPDYLKPVRQQQKRSNSLMIWKTNMLDGEKIICPLVLDGGNLVHFNDTLICTNKVFNENPNIPDTLVIEVLEESFDSEIKIIPVEPKDWLGHADGVVRFVNKDTVLVNRGIKNNPLQEGYIKVLTKLLKGYGFYVESLILGQGSKLKAAEGLYLNYLEVGNYLFVPVYNIPEDQEAIDELTTYFPNKNVVAIRSNSIARLHGVLRCISWVIKSGATA